MTKKEILKHIEDNFGGDVNKFYSQFPTKESFDAYCMGGKVKKYEDGGYETPDEPEEPVKVIPKKRGTLRNPSGDFKPGMKVYTETKYDKEGNIKKKIYRDKNSPSTLTAGLRAAMLGSGIYGTVSGLKDDDKSAPRFAAGQTGLVGFGLAQYLIPDKGKRVAVKKYADGGMLPSFQYGYAGDYNNIGYVNQDQSAQYNAPIFEEKDTEFGSDTSSAMTSTLASAASSSSNPFVKFFGGVGTLAGTAGSAVGAGIGGLSGNTEEGSEIGGKVAGNFISPFSRQLGYAKEGDTKGLLASLGGPAGTAIYDVAKYRKDKKETEAKNKINQQKEQDFYTRQAMGLRDTDITAGLSQEEVSPYQEYYGGQGIRLEDGGNVVTGAQAAPGSMDWSPTVPPQYMVDHNENIHAANGNIYRVVSDTNGSKTDDVAVTENNNGVPVAVGGGKLVPLRKAEDGGSMNSTYITTNNFKDGGFTDISKDELSRILKL